MSGMSDLNAEMEQAASRAMHKAAKEARARSLLRSSVPADEWPEGYQGRRLVDSAIMVLGLTAKTLRSTMLKLEEPQSSQVEEVAMELEGLRTRLCRIDFDAKEEP